VPEYKYFKPVFFSEIGLLCVICFEGNKFHSLYPYKYLDAATAAYLHLKTYHITREPHHHEVMVSDAPHGKVWTVLHEEPLIQE